MRRYKLIFLKKCFVQTKNDYIFAPANTFTQRYENRKCENKQGTLAQMVEQWTENPCVPGSIPGGTTKPE